MTKEIKQTKDIQTVIDELAIKGVEALNEMADFTQEQVDHIVHHAAIAALDKHMYLAKLAVDETGRGIYEDKASKMTRQSVLLLKIKSKVWSLSLSR